MSPSALFEARADRINGGLNLNTDRNLAWEEISDGLSLRYERGAGIMTGPGFLKVATPVESVGYDGSYEATKIRATAWIKLGTKIMYSHDCVTWYDSGATVTADLPTGIIESPDGDMLVSNVTDTPYQIVVGKAKTAIADTDITISVGTVHINKFPASGTVQIRGDAVAYTGRDTGAGTLTGVTGIQSGGHPIDSLIVLAQHPSTWVEEKGYILIIVEGKLIVMGRTDYEDVAYYSATYDAISHPEFIFDFDGNGSYFHFLPGKVTAAITGVSGGYIFGEKFIHQILGFDPASGGLLTKEISTSYGAYNHKCVVDMDGVVGFQGRKRFIPLTLTLSPEALTAPFLNETFDAPLRPWYESHDDPKDQASAYLKWDSTQKIMKMGAVRNGALETYVADIQEGKFLPKENRSVGTSFMFQGKSYFGHRDNGRLFEDDTGRTNDGVIISHKITTGSVQYDKGRKYLEGKEFQYEGWTTQNAQHRLRIYVDGSTVAAFDEEFDAADLITSSNGRPIGLRGIGLSSPGGSTGGTTTVFPFENNLIIRGINGDRFKFEWEVTGDGHFLQVCTWYFGAFPTRRQPRTLN